MRVDSVGSEASEVAAVVGERVAVGGLRVELARSRRWSNRSTGDDGAGEVQGRKGEWLHSRVVWLAVGGDIVAGGVRGARSGGKEKRPDAGKKLAG